MRNQIQVVVGYMLILGSTLAAIIQKTCVTNVCSRSQFGLYCPDRGLIHVNRVTCNLLRGQRCVVARRNILSLCTGQHACASQGLRRLLRVCQGFNKLKPEVTVYYSCLKETMIVNTCNVGQRSDIALSQGVITSPNFTLSTATVAYDSCFWSFIVPNWKAAEVTVTYLTSRLTEGACKEPLIQISYFLCNGGGVKTKDFCGEVMQPDRSRACGTVKIYANGFGRRHESGTRFIMSIKIDDSAKIRLDRPLTLTSLQCGGRPFVPKNLVTLQTGGGSNGTVTVAMDTTIEPVVFGVKNGADESVLSKQLLLVIILTVSAAVIIILLVSFIVVCYKATTYGNYRKDKAEARRRSRESSTSRTGYRSSKHGGSSIEDDIDDDLIIKNTDIYNTSFSERPKSENFAKYLITSNGHAWNSDTVPTVLVRPRSDFTYSSSYASITDANTPLPFTSNDNHSSLGDIIAINQAPNYESLSHYNNADGRSIGGDYDNVEVTSDISEKLAKKSPDTISQNGDVPHYFVNGDTYAIVTKSPSGHSKGKQYFGDVNNKKGNKLKSPYMADSRYKNHIGYIEDDEMY